MTTGTMGAVQAAEGRTASHPRRNASGLLVAVLSAAAFGTSGTLGKAMLDLGWSPAATVAARVGGGCLVLLVPCLLVLRQTGLPSLRQSGRVLAYGIVAVAAAQLCYFSAVQYLSVGVALLLEYTAPVLLIFWRWAHGQRPTRSMLGGAALALLGLALVLDLRHGLTVNLVGVAWAMAAAVCLAAFFVLGDERPGTPAVHPLVLTTGGLGTGALVLLAVGLTGGLPLHVGFGTSDLAGVSVPWWVPMALLVVVAAAFSYTTGIIAVRMLGSAVASFVSLSEVLFAVAFAALLLSQHPSPDQLVGGLLVLAGIVAVQGGAATTLPRAVGRIRARVRAR